MLCCPEVKTFMGRVRLIKIEELSERTKDAAMYVVAKHGLADLSINSISRQSEISENHIYRHFGTKDEILYQCYKAVTEKIVSELDDPKRGTYWHDRSVSILEKFWSRYIEALIELDYKALFWQEYRNSKIFEEKIKEPKWRKKYGHLQAKLDMVVNQYFRYIKCHRYRFVKMIIITQADMVARHAIENKLNELGETNIRQCKRDGLDLLLVGLTESGQNRLFMEEDETGE